MLKKLSDNFYSACAGSMGGISVYCASLAFNGASKAIDETLFNAMSNSIVGTTLPMSYTTGYTEAIILGAIAIGAGMAAVDAVRKPNIQKKRPVAMIAGAMATLAGIALVFNTAGSEPTPTKSAVHDAGTIELYQNSSNVELSAY